jgi:hypothetical protein
VCILDYLAYVNTQPLGVFIENCVFFGLVSYGALTDLDGLLISGHHGA